MEQEPRDIDKMEEMLVIPFIVIINASILVPLGILCYQIFTWIRIDEWNGLSLINLSELLGMDLSGLYEPRWEGIKNVITGFMEWPLSITSGLLIFFAGWFIIFSVCVIVEIITRFRSGEIYINTIPTSEIENNTSH